ncbi:hypothetical protein OIU79_001771 [Salix purpurea]|uniref:Uncharacterized protein n=1 Tax=Salix purpurea TaxID=77065 RepID=A0A9Q0UQM1_SALPP|nr:hypothetical protein OIU79_001771 [Salix purpurea]
MCVYVMLGLPSKRSWNHTRLKSLERCFKGWHLENIVIYGVRSPFLLCLQGKEM